MAKAKATGTADVLTLSTTDWVRPTIAIDGKRYVMRSPDELTVPMLREMTTLGERIGKAQGNLDDLAQTIGDGLDRIMIDLPVKVRDSLTLGQQSEILGAFSKLAGWTAAPARKGKARSKAGTRRRPPAAGRAKSSRSRGRSGSTGARSATG